MLSYTESPEPECFRTPEPESFRTLSSKFFETEPERFLARGRFVFPMTGSTSLSATENVASVGSVGCHPPREQNWQDVLTVFWKIIGGRVYNTSIVPLRADLELIRAGEGLHHPVVAQASPQPEVRAVDR
jgi:hypothetical protein